MASELRVNTLKDAAGNNSIGLSYVAEGSAKSWVRYTCASTTASDSFNVSGLTDNGTGDFTTTFSNSMSNANFCVPTSCSHVNAGATMYGNNPHTYATGSVRCDSFETSAVRTDEIDANNNSVAVLGDLA